jgi:hypothetical protein
MRLNIISTHRNQTGLSQDADILHGIFAAVDKDVSVARIPHFYTHAPEAEVNVFLEVVNMSLLPFAAKNIWIPNPEWTYKTWKPYCAMFDEIWVKTHEAEEIFRSMTTTPVKYIGWTSIDKGFTKKKNYSKAMVLVGKNIYRHPQMFLDACASLEDLPELHIPYDASRMEIKVPEALQSKVRLYPGTLKEKEYNAILEECGLAICLSGSEGFGHAVNEAMSSGCNLLLGDIVPFRELTEQAIWVYPAKKVEHPECLGLICAWNHENIQNGLRAYGERSFKDRKAISEKVRKEYETRHAAWLLRMTPIVTPLTKTPRHDLKTLLPAEDELPSVSILTPTRDRLKFMELAKECFQAFAYPKDKLEWVVIDDGEISCKHIVQDMPNVKYVWEETGKTIAWKRNRAVQVASHGVLVHMDDDDVYPANTILSRVAMLLAQPSKQCVFCTTIPCYDIQNYISFVNVPPMKLEMAARVSEATMAYTRTFWEEKGFDDEVKIAEGHTFIHGREHMCREISPQDVIVSLVHSKTTSSRKAPAGMTSNGCHYGFSDDLFKHVSDIGTSL